MAEKRRREDELDESNNDGNKVMILEAKNKGLATNLYSYKRQIHQLEQQVHRLGKNNSAMYNLLSGLQANLLQMESDLRDCLNFVPPNALDTSVRDPLHSIGTSLDGGSSTSSSSSSSSSSASSSFPLYQSIADPSFLKLLFSSHPSSTDLEDPSLYSSILSNLGFASSSTTTTTTVVDYTETPSVTVHTPPELFIHHIQFLQKASRLIIQSVMNKALSSSSSSASSLPTITSKQIEEIQARHRSAINHVTALQAEIRQRDTNIQVHLARIKGLEEEARTTVRTLERLRYDHPELEEKIRNILATSQFTSPSTAGVSSSSSSSLSSSTTTAQEQLPSGVSITASTPSANIVTDHSMEDTTMDSSKRTTVPYPDTPQSMVTESFNSTPLPLGTTILSSSSFSHPFPMNDSISTPGTPSHLLLSRSNSLQGIDSSDLSIDNLRTERDTLRITVDDLQTKLDSNIQRLQVLEESLKQETNLVTSLQKRYHGNTLPDKDVQSHPMYVDLFQLHHNLNETYKQLETKLQQSDSKLFAIQDELSLERSRYTELLQVTGLNDQSARKAYEEQIEKLYGTIENLTKERDNALDKMAENNTRIQLYDHLEKTFKEQTNALESWKQQYNSIHTSLAQRVNTLLTSSTSSPGTTDVTKLQEEIIDLRNERDGLIASLESVSTGFENAGTERDKLLVLLSEKDEEMHRSLLTAQKFQIERNVLLSDMAAKDNVIQELKQVQENATTALSSKDSLITEYRNRVSSTEEKLTELEKQLQYYTDRRQQDNRYNLDNVKQLQTMKEKLDAVYKDINEYIDKDKVSRQTIQDLQTKYEEHQKKYAKLEEKYTKLKEKEKETRATTKIETDGTPGLGRSSSTISLSSHIGGNTDLSSTGSMLDVAELNILRSLVICTVCKIRRRNCTLIRCHHTFCKNCIDDRVKLRQRKCPSCNTVFAENDIHTIYLA